MLSQCRGVVMEALHRNLKGPKQHMESYCKMYSGLCVHVHVCVEQNVMCLSKLCVTYSTHV